MLGPLPTLYRVVVATVALLAFVGIGAWISLVLPESFVPLMGAGIGAGIGAVAVLLLLHDSQSHGPTSDIRIRSHRRH